MHPNRQWTVLTEISSSTKLLSQTFKSTDNKVMFICCCSRERSHVMGLMKRFPNLDLEAVKQQFPSVDIEKIRYHKKTRGHRENIC
jgi:hypothetical protein